jgi:alpha-tubulin suppressor-like RCC1 family protein
VWSWGWNAYGQLGDGTKTNRSLPVRAGTISNAVAVAAGANHSLALSSDGTMWAWGQGSYGQLGLGDTAAHLRPAQVAITNVVSIGAGRLHSLAVKGDGTAWAWGRNDFGQLGDGTKTNRKAPVRVIGVSTADEIAGGRDFSVALVG